MSEHIELGTISSRGQVAIPSDMRKEMGLEEGTKILFFLEDDTLLIKKVSTQSWKQITEPLRIAKKKIEEKDVDKLVHEMRK